MTFMLAMVEHPRVWKRAQAEIDAVVGTDRLPEFDDGPSLPYVDAIIREVLRWRPVLPLSTCQKAGVLSILFLFLNVHKLPCARRRKVMSTTVTIYHKVCPTGVCCLLVVVSPLPGTTLFINTWYALHSPRR